MQRTMQWLYAAKWAPKSRKYVCNSLSRLRCKLLKIQCGLNPVVPCQSVYGYHGHGCLRISPANISYSAPNMDACLLLAPFRSKCCQLDVPLLMNWAFAPQLGILIPQRECSCHRIILKFSGVITIDSMMSMQKVKVKVKGQGHRSWTHLALSGP